MNINQRQAGFTLIELMIVVAIVGVLAAIAYPSYREQVAKSRRTELKTVMSSGQQWMERFYTENFRYDKNSAGTRADDSSQFASRFSVSPTPGQGNPVYDLAVVIVEGKRDSYSITATRKAASFMANDRCGDVSVDHLGRKSVKNYRGFATELEALRDCWR